jgi:hypothetical protein
MRVSVSGSAGSLQIMAIGALNNGNSCVNLRSGDFDLSFAGFCHKIRVQIPFGLVAKDCKTVLRGAIPQPMFDQ